MILTRNAYERDKCSRNQTILLEESVSITENITEAKGYRTRAHFRLSQLYSQLDNGENSQQCENAAKKGIAQNGSDTDLTNKHYDNCVIDIVVTIK